jgi:arabinogalactan endo-1,4-beta-galactosidase
MLRHDQKAHYAVEKQGNKNSLRAEVERKRESPNKETKGVVSWKPKITNPLGRLGVLGTCLGPSWANISGI